jgi:hypothetical protein
VSLSVLFIYEEYKQTDFIKEFSLEETFIGHLAMMFPSLIYTPVSETGEAVNIAPSPWDEKKVHSALGVVPVPRSLHSLHSRRRCW